MQSWEEYIKSNISKFREQYERLPKETIEQLAGGNITFGSRMLKKTQVVVGELVDGSEIFLIANSQKHPDLETLVLKCLPLDDLLDWLGEEPRMQELFGEDTGIVYGWIESEIEEKGFLIKESPAWTDKVIILFYPDEVRSSPYVISNELMGILEIYVENLAIKNQRMKLEETVDNLKRDAEAIPETVQLRNNIIENTKRLENQFKELTKKVEGDVSAIREILGTNKEIIGWRVFSTDVKYLKDTHVAKDLFDVHVKRLDEKIEKGLEHLDQKTEKGFEALNTRIEDLKAIKFWSKRTVLEIALTVWGAFLTLYVAGIIKF